MQRKPPTIIRLLALVLAVTALAAACGNDDTDTQIAAGADGDATHDDGTTSELPPADESLPPAAGACLEGTVDCNDTPGDLGQPILEPGDETGGDTVGMLVDGGISPEDALAMGTSDEIVAVRGFLVQDDSGARLCGVLAESLPPQCGGGALVIENFDPELVDVPLANAQGVTWTDDAISLLGSLDNSVLTVDLGVAG